ncbi:MAG TPA: serine/threonine-protein kinase, partial [Kofleriaceae bacterium]
ISLAVGEQIDRFTVTRKLGEGGMGQVWAARDGELDREVALKLLNVRFDDERAKERLKREAQAMAKLRHPNVVTIYELGSDHGRVFCAMELVDGTTLRKWEKHGWRETVKAVISAGRGLAAAHRVGLVHRDIKPDNVLIANDGRVLVTDFGLAKAVSDAPLADGGPLVGLHALITVDERCGRRGDPLALTKPNTVVGTPAYMAPEQLAGRGATAASDQFSFCVMLFEALFDKRPFDDEAENVEDILASQEHLVMPPRGDVPARVMRAIERGLAFAPEHRWPSVEDLLAQLERSLVSRRWKLGAVFGAVVLGGLAFVAWPRGPSAHAVAVQQIDRAWGPAIRDAVISRFTALRGEHAATESRIVTNALDHYREAWLALRDAARSTPQIECLDTLETKLERFTNIVLHADEHGLAYMPTALFRLDRVATCGEVPRLEATLPAPTSPAGRLAEAAVGSLETLVVTGRFIEAIDKGPQVIANLESLGEPRWVARATYELGMANVDLAEIDRSKKQTAEELFRRAIQIGEAANDRVLVADASIARYLVLAGEPLRARGASISETDSATATAIARAGNDPQHTALLSLARASTAGNRQDLLPARDQLLDARAKLVAIHGEEHPDVARVDLDLGRVLSALGHYDEARVVYFRALETYKLALGSTDDVAVVTFYEIGTAALRAKWYDEAIHYLREDIAATTRLASQSRMIRYGHLGLAEALRRKGELDGATAELASVEDAFENDIVGRPSFLVEKARLAEARGHHAEAVKLATAAVDHM